MRQKWLSERRRMNRKLRTLLRLDTREICPEAKLRVLTDFGLKLDKKNKKYWSTLRFEPKVLR